MERRVLRVFYHPSLPQGYLAVSGNIFDPLRLCYLPSSEIEAEDPANLPTMHRTATTTKNDLAQNVDSAVVEDPSSAGPP